MIPTNDKDKMQKIAGIQKEPAKLTHRAMYNGEVINKYADGTIRVHGMEFKSTNDAKSYIDHISR
jgi:hypothetical protein